MSSRRDIPSVNLVLRELGDVGIPRQAVVAFVRDELSGLRKAADIPGREEIVDGIRESLERFRRLRIQPVINGTGVLVHTNLGRAPLGDHVIRTVADVAGSYTNLELDLDTGKRGGRAVYLERNLALLCSAEAATVVNNCAAALVLILRHFCAGKRNEVVISRGELIQIGGGFRIPDILESSGARLREVGTTNKTSIKDYERAIGKRTGLLLKVHRSNFFMKGFVASPSREELAVLAKKMRVPFVEDLGSGAVMPTEKMAPIEHEPTPGEVLGGGVHLVCFSGDKLLGGPQAGIVAGKKRLIRALKKEPFYRVLRCDKLVLSALQATVDAYVGDRPEASVPMVNLLRASIASLEARADRMVVELASVPAEITRVTSKAAVGGGSLPRSEIPSVAIAIRPAAMCAKELAGRLRAGEPPVIAVVEKGRVKVDLRTVFVGQDRAVVTALARALAMDS